MNVASIRFGAFVARKLAFLVCVLCQAEHEARNKKKECLKWRPLVLFLQVKK